MPIGPQGPRGGPPLKKRPMKPSVQPHGRFGIAQTHFCSFNLSFFHVTVLFLIPFAGCTILALGCKVSSINISVSASHSEAGSFPWDTPVT